MKRLPIRLRITALSAVAAGLASLILVMVGVWSAWSTARDDLDTFLGQEAQEALALVSRGGSLSAIVDLSSVSGPSQRVALYDASGALIDVTPLSPPQPDLEGDVSRYENLPAADGSDQFRSVVIPFDSGDGRRVLVVAAPTSFVRDRVVEATLTFLGLALVVVGALSAGGYLLSGFALAPVERLRSSAADLAGDPGGRRLELPPADDEIRRLGETLNGALEAVDESIALQRQFVAEASHELRTPIARLSAEVELARRPTRTPEEVQTALSEINEHIRELTDISDNLLDALANRGQARGRVEATVSSIMADLALLIPPDAALAVSLSDESGASTVNCDRRELVRAIRNLVDNALEHGAPPVTVSAVTDTSSVRIRVCDEGAGVPSGDRERLRMPFIRGDSDAGRAGLGLAIASRTVERHGGTLEILEADRGCVVEVVLPLSSQLRG